MKRKKRNKFGFTLLEIIICMSLIVSIGLFASFKGYKLLQDARFCNSVKIMSAELRLTHVLASSHSIDIDIHLIQKDNYLELLRTTDNPPESIKQLFNKPIKLNNLHISNQSLTLEFYSNGWLTPKEDIICKSSDRSGEKKISGINFSVITKR